MRPAPRRHRARLAAALALLVFISTVVAAFALSTAAPVAPAGPAPLYSALAEVERCDGVSGCQVLEVSLASDWDGDGGLLCVTATFRRHVEQGCADVDQSFGLGPDAITWAEVPETSVDLYETRCNDRLLCQDALTRTIAIEGVWAGEGETLRFDQSFGRHYGACTWPDNIGGVVRMASLLLVIDGEPIEAFGNIRVVDSTNIPQTTCANLQR